MLNRNALLNTVLTMALGMGPAVGIGHSAVEDLVERGRYMVKIAGCNDCHTPGYMETAGGVPESEWLIGSQLGWRGPWGTTYPPNLRLYMQNLSEDQWVQTAHSVQLRPPMPWFILRDMSVDDLRAIYQFVRYLGPAGEMAPPFVPPDQTPEGAFVIFPSPPDPQ